MPVDLAAELRHAVALLRNNDLGLGVKHEVGHKPDDTNNNSSVVVLVPHASHTVQPGDSPPHVEGLHHVVVEEFNFGLAGQGLSDQEKHTLLASLGPYNSATALQAVPMSALSRAGPGFEDEADRLLALHAAHNHGAMVDNVFDRNEGADPLGAGPASPPGSHSGKHATAPVPAAAIDVASPDRSATQHSPGVDAQNHDQIPGYHHLLH